MWCDSRAPTPVTSSRLHCELLFVLTGLKRRRIVWEGKAGGGHWHQEMGVAQLVRPLLPLLTLGGTIRRYRPLLTILCCTKRALLACRGQGPG